MAGEIEELFAKLEEIREVILANAGQVAALRATIDALIFTHSDLPRFSVALTALMERTDAVLNGQAQDGILDAFRKQRIAVETTISAKKGGAHDRLSPTRRAAASGSACVERQHSDVQRPRTVGIWSAALDPEPTFGGRASTPDSCHWARVGIGADLRSSSGAS